MRFGVGGCLRCQGSLFLETSLKTSGVLDKAGPSKAGVRIALAVSERVLAHAVWPQRATDRGAAPDLGRIPATAIQALRSDHFEDRRLAVPSEREVIHRHLAGIAPLGLACIVPDDQCIICYTPTPRESEDPPCQTARSGFYRTDDTARLSGHRIAAKPDRVGSGRVGRSSSGPTCERAGVARRWDELRGDCEGPVAGRRHHPHLVSPV